MSGAKNDPKVEQFAPIEWTHFIANQAPGKFCPVLSAVEIVSGNPVHACPSILLHCDSEMCNGEHFFDAKSSRNLVGEGANFYLTYVCRHCRKTTKVYAFHLKRRGLTDICDAYKFGEWPPFGPHVPSRVLSLIGEDQEYFSKGRRSESAGLGIGAFAYYRRVVENQKGRIFDEILSVFDRLGGSTEKRGLIVKAQAETQFSKAVDLVKDAIPESIRINGHSPLTLLHSALSVGVHELTDEQCLERANSIRLVLAELAERIRNAMRDNKELNEAVTKLLNKNKDGSGEQKVKD